eukprot:TRINITY_DN156_c0_g1_i1.p1 TRINITY_DN156_c0_g1~~TRINITY_DN156_c0_g1_i1.p1  ORF type:complete len:360 (+),score=173.54 TRINITY_DN156_c0_g1_i1:49-1128(+)
MTIQAIVEGCTVRVEGLKKRADANGKSATALSAAGDRWVVELEDGEQLKILTKNLTVLAPPPAEVEAEGDAGTEEAADDDDDGGEEDEEDEEDEEGSEDESEESETDRLEVLTLSRKDPTERLGLDFVASNDLTLEGITPGTTAGNTPAAARYIGWTLRSINGAPVDSLAAAAPLIKNQKSLKLAFFKKGVVYVQMPAPPAGTSPTTPVSFKIPLDAPLNPNASIEIAPHPKTGTLRYKVNGASRPAFDHIVFDLMGDNYTRELRFPSLGTCMWLPAAGFETVYPALRAMVAAHGKVQSRGFQGRFRKELLEEVEGLESAAAEERLAKAAKKQLPTNQKKRKLVRRALKQSAAKKQRTQ